MLDAGHMPARTFRSKRAPTRAHTHACNILFLPHTQHSSPRVFLLLYYFLLPNFPIRVFYLNNNLQHSLVHAFVCSAATCHSRSAGAAGGQREEAEVKCGRRRTTPDSVIVSTVRGRTRFCNCEYRARAPKLMAEVVGKRGKRGKRGKVRLAPTATLRLRGSRRIRARSRRRRKT